MRSGCSGAEGPIGAGIRPSAPCVCWAGSGDPKFMFNVTLTVLRATCAADDVPLPAVACEVKYTVVRSASLPTPSAMATPVAWGGRCALGWWLIPWVAHPAGSHRRAPAAAEPVASTIQQSASGTSTSASSSASPTAAPDGQSHSSEQQHHFRDRRWGSRERRQSRFHVRRPEARGLVIIASQSESVAVLRELAGTQNARFGAADSVPTVRMAARRSSSSGSPAPPVSAGTARGRRSLAQNGPSAASLNAMKAMTPTMMQSVALATELPHSRADVRLCPLR
jgi:hypothetical protein